MKLYAGIDWIKVRGCADIDCKSTVDRMDYCRDSPAKTTEFDAERMCHAIDKEDAQMHAFTDLINEESARAERAERNMQQELEQVPVPPHQTYVLLPWMFGYYMLICMPGPPCKEATIDIVGPRACARPRQLPLQALISLLLLTGDGSDEAD